MLGIVVIIISIKTVPRQETDGVSALHGVTANLMFFDILFGYSR